MDILISVIVPIYKVETFLDKCISSIVDQTYKNLEIILVDDGSPDNCPQKCDEWAKKDSRIKVIHKENGGVSSARNAALDIAKGDYICFVDGDDYVAIDLYEKIVNLLRKNPFDIIVFDANRIDLNGDIFSSTEKIQEGLINSESALAELLNSNINSYVWDKVYKKSLFDDVRFPVNRKWEDVATIYKLFMKTNNIYCYPQKMYFYLKREESITKQALDDKTLGDIFIARYECYLDLKDTYPNLRELAVLRTVLIARRFIDRSFWGNVDENLLNIAKNFLQENKDFILKNTDDKACKFYYKAPKLYRFLRKTKHNVGNIVKRIKR